MQMNEIGHFVSRQLLMTEFFAHIIHRIALYHEIKDNSRKLSHPRSCSLLQLYAQQQQWKRQMALAVISSYMLQLLVVKWWASA